MTRRNFSNLSLQEVIELVGLEDTCSWQLNEKERSPSNILEAILERYNSFGLLSSEPAKLLLVDAILGEIVPLYPNLKVWKSESLESGSVGGMADYLIAPRRAFVKTPLLCAIEAKPDDFLAGEIQCIAEMAVCQQNNLRYGHATIVHGIISNGQI